MRDAIGVFVTSMLFILVVRILYKQFPLTNKTPRFEVPCLIQRFCDPDIFDNTWRSISAGSEYELQTKRIEKLRREYREWVENCNLAHRRVIPADDEVA